jgi:hypothetical protein
VVRTRARSARGRRSGREVMGEEPAVVASPGHASAGPGSRPKREAPLITFPFASAGANSVRQGATRVAGSRRRSTRVATIWPHRRAASAIPGPKVGLYFVASGSLGCSFGSLQEAASADSSVARIVAFTDNLLRRTCADPKSGPERDVGRGSIRVAPFVTFFVLEAGCERAGARSARLRRVG